MGKRWGVWGGGRKGLAGGGGGGGLLEQNAWVRVGSECRFVFTSRLVGIFDLLLLLFKVCTIKLLVE